MEYMLKTAIYKKLIKLKKEIYTFADIKKVTGLENDNSTYQAIKRLKKDSILESAANRVYYLSDNPPSEFLLANNLYPPSYISLESALNYYGIIIQVPQVITSVSTKKTKYITAKNKEFLYSHINKNYFFDYIKEKDFLIATPEKALIDTIFFTAIGKSRTDLSELFLSNVNKKRFHKLKEKIKNKSFHKLTKGLKI